MLGHVNQVSIKDCSLKAEAKARVKGLGAAFWK